MASIKAVTWNISYDPGGASVGADARARQLAAGVVPWEQRRDAVIAAVSMADVIALQEVGVRQLADVAAALPDHTVLSVTTPLPAAAVAYMRERLGGQAEPEHELVEIALLLRDSVFSARDRGHCWLSPTPERALSAGWGNIAPRQLLWVTAEHRATRDPLLLATTHVDLRAVRPMLELLRDRLEAPAVAAGAAALLGDLNTHTDPDAFRVLLSAGWRDAHPTGRLAEDPTYLGDTHGGPARIDHVMTRGRVHATGWARELSIANEGLSDHLPVRAELRLG